MRTRILLVLLVLVALVVLVASVQSQTLSPAPVTPTQPLQFEKPNPNASVTDLEARGDELRLGKYYAPSLEFYRAALQKDARNPILYNKAGISELQINDLDAAKKDFERALKYDPKYAEARNNLGVVHYLRRDYKKAIRNYEKAIALDETSASFYSNLGSAWFARKNYERAMKEYAHAMELDPNVFLRTSTGGVAARLASPEDRARYSFLLAKLYAQHGDLDRCLQCLHDAKDGGYPKMRDVYQDPAFARVREDPRFLQLQIPAPPVE